MIGPVTGWMLLAVGLRARADDAAALVLARVMDTCCVQGPGEGSLAGRREGSGSGAELARGLGGPGGARDFLGARGMDLGL